MSFEWPARPVGELTINHDGRRRPVKESDRRRGPYPYYGASGIVDSVDGYLFDGCYLLIGEDGENLRTRQTPIAFLASGKFWVNNHAHIVTGNDLADTRFLMYALLNADISAYLTGAVMPKLTQGNLNRIELPCPPRAVQQSIVETLSALDDRIALLRETNVTLETIAQALFKSWFVDFDPVRAKQQGLPTAGMDEATAALFPDGFEDSTLGRVPRGWRTGSILEVADLLSGGTPKTDRSEFWGGNIAWASAKDVSQAACSILVSTERTITTAGLERSATRLIPRLATVVVARGATTGRMVMFGREMAMNQTCYGLTSKLGAPVALYCLLRREIDALVNAAHGSVFDTITTSTFARSIVIQPPASILARFEEIGRPLFERIAESTTRVQTLASLRDTLLPRLISGQLRLPEAAKQITDATT